MLHHDISVLNLCLGNILLFYPTKKNVGNALANSDHFPGSVNRVPTGCHIGLIGQTRNGHWDDSGLSRALPP